MPPTSKARDITVIVAWHAIVCIAGFLLGCAIVIGGTP